MSRPKSCFARRTRAGWMETSDAKLPTEFPLCPHPDVFRVFCVHNDYCRHLGRQSAPDAQSHTYPVNVSYMPPNRQK